MTESRYQFRLFFLLIVSFFYIQTTTSAQCSISNLTVEASDCSDDDSFDAIINFDYVQTFNNGFQVLGNGVLYGTYAYDNLPITIFDLAGDCTTNYEFIVRDVEDPTCSDFIDFGTVCCNQTCSIEFLDINVSDCTDDNTFDISFNVDYEFVEQNTFDVFLNDEIMGTFGYDVLPVMLTGISSDIVGINTLKICNNDDSECCDTYTFLNPCDCAITSITGDIIDCEESDSSYYAIIDFDHIATNDSFQMGYSEGGDNNFLGVFAYADLPVLAGPIFWSDEEREILIVDQSDFFCFNSAYLGIVNDCDIQCQVYNVFAEHYDCEDGQYYIDIEFDAEDIEGATFEVIVDDTNYGTFTYGETFYTVGPIAENCDGSPVVVIQDSNQELCSDFYIFDEPICCGGMPCEFTTFETTVECNLEDGVVIFADYSNLTANPSDQFFVNFQGQTYGPYPPSAGAAIFNVPDLTNGVYPIEIFVDGNPDCSAEATVTVDCVSSECQIFNVFAEAYECEESMTLVDVTFEYAGEVSDSFEIRGNGVSYGIFAYGEEFYTLGPIEVDCETILEFIVIDQMDTDCRSFFGFDIPLCCDECEISQLEVFDIECSETGIEGFFLNFTAESTSADAFYLNVDGLSIGIFAYDQLPIQIEGDFPATIIVQVQDTMNITCGSDILLESDCGGIPDCILDEGVLVVTECTETEYNLELSMFHESTSDSFIVTYLDVSLTYAYDDLPVILPGLPINEQLTFTIMDQMAAECFITREFFLEQCETSIDETAFDNINIVNQVNNLIIQNQSRELLSLDIYTINGIQISQSTLLPNQDYNSASTNLNQGIYLISLNNGTSRKTIKFVILE